MKGWKKTVTSVFLICSVLVLVGFFFLVCNSELANVVKGLLFALGIVQALGILLFSAVYVYSLRHQAGVLAVGPDGRIAIEYTALRSVAAYSLKNLEGIQVLKIVPKVVRKGDTSFVDFKVDVSVLSELRMSSAAAQIQTCVKKSVEAFCDSQVRNVNVHFVLPKASSVKRPASKVKALLEDLSSQD